MHVNNIRGLCCKVKFVSIILQKPILVKRHGGQIIRASYKHFVIEACTLQQTQSSEQNLTSEFPLNASVFWLVLLCILRLRIKFSGDKEPITSEKAPEKALSRKNAILITLSYVDWLNYRVISFKHIATLLAQHICMTEKSPAEIWSECQTLPTPPLICIMCTQSSHIKHEATSNFTQFFSVGSNSRPRVQLFSIRTSRPANTVYKHKCVNKDVSTWSKMWNYLSPCARRSYIFSDPYNWPHFRCRKQRSLINNPHRSNWSWMYFPKRLLFMLRTVWAFPNASRIGLESSILCSILFKLAASSGLFKEKAYMKRI